MAMKKTISTILSVIMLLSLQPMMLSKSSSKSGKQKRCKTESFYFDAIGDTVYSTGARQPLNRLINEVINKECAEFVVHIGDTQTPFKSYPPAAQGLLAYGDPVVSWDAAGFVPVREQLFQIKHPLIITPGDNDWSDTAFAGNPDPIGTLQAFREVVVRPRNTNFPFKVISQSDVFPEFSEFIENRIWQIGCVLFVTIHTVSTANGLTNPNPAVVSESQKRIQADVAWLKYAFDRAQMKNLKGVCIFTQTSGSDYNSQFKLTNNLGFEEIMQFLYAEATGRSQSKQILYVYGDFHQPMVTWPFKRIICPGAPLGPGGTDVAQATPVPNFTAIEVPGWITEGRMRVQVDPCDKNGCLFKICTDINSFPSIVERPELCVIPE